MGGSVIRRFVMPYLSESFASRFEADLAAEVLAENEIAAHVSASDAGGSVPALQPTLGVRLEVSEEDLSRAESIVTDWRDSEGAYPPPLSTGQKVQSWIGMGLFVAFLVILFVSVLRSTPTGDQPQVPPQAQSPW